MTTLATYTDMNRKNEKKEKVDKKKELILATWNVRGTNEAGSYNNLVQICKRYKCDIMALQETKQKTHSIFKLGDYVIFNGESESSFLGTGFIINKELKDKVIEFKCWSGRLSKIRIRGLYRKISIINVHAPTNEKDEEEKEKFYESLSEILQEIPRYDIKIVVGDFNAKVGREDIYKQVTGGHSKHKESNDNGIKLIEFATEVDMKIMSTYFQRKEIHKGTWVSPDGKTCNQIDHVLTEKKYANIVKNVTSQRGADADSDHFMVRIFIKQEIPRCKENKNKRRSKYNIQELQNEETQDNFKENVELMFKEIPSESNVNEKWMNLEQNLKKVTETTLEQMKTGKMNKWFDNECNDQFEKKNQARITLLANTNEQNKRIYDQEKREFKKICRQKKRKFMEDRLISIEENYKNKQIRNFYQDIKKQKEGYQQPVIFLKDKNGLLVSGEEKMKQWAEYFSELLNENQENQNEESQENEEEIQEVVNEIESPDMNEIIEILKNFKNNKSPGENGISAEIYKYGGEHVQRELLAIVQDVWRTERMPERWKQTLLHPIHKKGDKTLCSNYRGIALLDIAYKVFATCIRNRLNPIANKNLGEYQAGFRSYRSTMDQIFSLKQIIANSYEHGLPLHILFIDFKQAYDSVKKEKLCEILQYFLVPKKLINMVRMTLTGISCKVSTEGQKSDSFNIRKGLRQGDPMSPVLFNIILEWVLRESKTSTNGTILDKKHQCLAYADDIAIITRTKQELARVFKNLEETALKVGLVINETKTKYMCVQGRVTEPEERLKVRNSEGHTYNFEAVSDFTYLGVKLTNNNDETLEIVNRLNKGSRCVGSLFKMLSAKSISRSAKVRVYKSVIRPTVLYGSELWVMNSVTQNKIDIWERKVLRKIYGGKQSGDLILRRTNVEISELYGEVSLSSEVRGNRVRWLGHVFRMDDNRAAKTVLLRDSGIKKRRGRPKEKWISAVCKDLTKLGITNWKNCASDRQQWKAVVYQAKGQLGL